MNLSIDVLRTASKRVAWSRIDPDGPGLHQPKRHGDVGWDLECAEDTLIRPGEAVDVPTNVRLALPDHIWAEIRARSSVARRGLQVDAGTIDNGYRGPLFALVRNMKQLDPRAVRALAEGSIGTEEWIEQNSVLIQKGERVAQVVFHKIMPVWDEEVPEVPLTTQRGEGGFGSTGRFGDHYAHSVPHADRE